MSWLAATFACVPLRRSIESDNSKIYLLDPNSNSKPIEYVHPQVTTEIYLFIYFDR